MELVIVILAGLLAVGVFYAVIKSKNISNDEKEALKRAAIKVADAAEKEVVDIAKPVVTEAVAEVKAKAKKVTTQKVAEVEKEVTNAIENIANNVVTPAKTTKAKSKTSKK